MVSSESIYEASHASEIVAWTASSRPGSGMKLESERMIGNPEVGGRLLLYCGPSTHCSRQRTTKIHLRRLVCDRWNPVILLANQVKRHAYPESVPIRVEAELRLTVRESQSQGFGASLDALEGSTLPKTLLQGA